MNQRKPGPSGQTRAEASSQARRADRWRTAGSPASPLTGPVTVRTITPLMGPAAPATVTPLLGSADRGTMVSLMGPADPGTATPLMLPSR
jgi:hypothetical protein